jgi:hypothetical protein
MGQVPVALKVMARARRETHAARFAREAGVLAELSHPAIVRYVVHGELPDGRPFLAMEWLDGEDLSVHLARSPLSAADAVSLVKRAAEGLAVAHARGVVHRDVKPSNLFLVAGDPGRIKVVDFGIARLLGSEPGPTARELTATGAVLGTVGYMSPEQAVGSRDLDARTDVFALGCVLFECLTGRPAFSGSRVVAVLAKVLWDDAPRLRDVRPELGSSLDDCLAQMLAKEPADRPTDASAVVRALEGLEPLPAGADRPVSRRPSAAVSHGEHRLVNVILALTDAAPARVEDVVARFGGQHARLVDGALLVTISGRGPLVDRAVHGVACALSLCDAFPDARVAVATERIASTGTDPAGSDPGGGGRLSAPIDRAATLLAGLSHAGVYVDQTSAGLVAGRFDLLEQPAGFLVTRTTHEERPRTLLSKPTPCLGRDKELGLLEGIWDECVSEPGAGVVLVVGPAGQGKTRLRHELLQRLRAKGPTRVLLARGDVVAAGSSLLLARQLVRDGAGLREGSPESAQYAELQEYVRTLGSVDAVRASEFLGELAGARPPEPGAPLRAARGDGLLMSEGLARAFGVWLAAESARGPLLLVLEDLHWGDAPTIQYLDEALRRLASRPRLVLALARPEVRTVFPKLWSDATEIRLGGLGRRAAEKLMRLVLGDDVDVGSVQRVVERAQGNAFYLEELIRRVAEAGADDLPDTVLALTESRLEALEPEARRLLRAASVLGEVFWNTAVASLLGIEALPEVGEWLAVLEDRELVSAQRSSKFEGARAYAFRHALVREAAYAMLPDSDRIAAHARAGEWLEGAGETDANVLADHFEKGQRADRAVRWIVRAAQVAIEAGTFGAAEGLLERGRTCGAARDDLTRLLTIRVLSLAFSGEWTGVVAAARQAIVLTTPGTEDWWFQRAALIYAGITLGDATISQEVMQSILSSAAPFVATRSCSQAAMMLVEGLSYVGQPEPARHFISQLRSVDRSGSSDPLFIAWCHLVDCLEATFLDENPGKAVRAATAAIEAFDAAEDRAGGWLGRAYMTMACFLAGRFAGISDRNAQIEKVLTPKLMADATCAWALVYEGAIEQGVRLAQKVFDFVAGQGVIGSFTRLVFADASLRSRDVQAAQAHIDAVESGMGGLCIFQVGCRALSARVALESGDPGRALAHAEAGLALYERVTYVHFGSWLHLVRSEALHALGREDEAQAALRQAHARLLRLSSTLDEVDREGFLANLDVHRRTLALARERTHDHP